MSLVIDGKKVPNTSTFKYDGNTVSVVKMVKDGTTTTVWSVLEDSIQYTNTWINNLESGEWDGNSIVADDSGMIATTIELKTTSIKGKKCRLYLSGESNYNVDVNLSDNSTGQVYIDYERYSSSDWDLVLDFTPTANTTELYFSIEDVYGDAQAVTLYPSQCYLYVGVDE